MAFLVPTIIMNMTSILLSSITSSVYNINTYILTNKNKSSLKMATFIREYDVIYKIKTIAQFIETIEIKSDLINSQVISIHDCISDIVKQLKIIEDRINYNKSIWMLSIVRAYGFDNRINELEILMKILNERFNLLLVTHKTEKDIFICNNI